LIIHYPTYDPRLYQSELLRAFFVDRYRYIYYLVHRRAGKDLTCWNLMWGAAIERVGTYFYMLPSHKQAKKVIWKGMIGDGTPFLKMIPKELIASINSTDMSITLVNGSIIYVLGGSNYDSVMGTNAVGIVLSEYGLHSPSIFGYLSPMILENNGWIICQTTPRGKNHAYHQFQSALKNPAWFVRMYTVADTKKLDGSPVITPEQIEQERMNGISDEMIRQEWFLDWNVGIQGAYFTKEIDQMEYEKRYGDFEINTHAPVFTAWDIGVSDPTSIILFQLNGNYLDVIYYIEERDRGVEYFKNKLDEVMQELNVRYRYHFAPHDIMQREWGSNANTRMMAARNVGINFQRVPNVSIDDGISALRTLFPRMRINSRYAAPLLTALREYRREYDEVNRTFKSKPLHNWASHPADAARYMALAFKETLANPALTAPRKFANTFSDGESSHLTR
jgi:phage terminase large subunit